MNYTDLCKEWDAERGWRAYARFDGVKKRFGKWGDGEKALPEAVAKYNRAVAEYLTTEQSPVSKNTVTTVAMLVRAFTNDLKSRYKGRTWEGQKHGMESEYNQALNHILEHYGDLPTEEFRSNKLMIVRDAMIKKGLYRKTINKRVKYIQQAFKWGVPREMVDIVTYTSLITIELLKEGEFELRESEPVLSVSVDCVQKTLTQAHYMLKDMIRAEIAGAMRPQDVRLIRLCDINRDDPDAWVYIPPQHKKAYKGKLRAIPITWECRSILASYVQATEDTPEEYLFSPADLMKTLAIDKGRKRKSKVPPSQLLRKANARKREYRPKSRRPGACYSKNAYSNAIKNAAIKAGVPHWTPNQLRHLTATEINKLLGINIAQQLLGHDSAKTTAVYIDPDVKREEGIEKARELCRLLQNSTAK